VSSELANELMSAASAESFLREQGEDFGWQGIAALKSHVDHLIRSDLNAAAELCERIDQLSQLAGDEVARAFADAARARVLHHRGRYGQANELYASSAEVLASEGLKAEASFIQTQQVYALTQAGLYGDALKTARAARRALGDDPARLAQLETNVGTVYYRLDRYRRALEHYDRALDILGETGDDTSRALVDFNRSHILTELDRHADAFKLLESVAERYERAGQHLFAWQARFHMAYIDFLRGNYNRALAAYYQARDRLAAMGSAILVAWCNQEIAEILLALNAFDDASESARAAESDFSKLDMPYESAQARVVVALAAMGLGHFDQAETNLTESREIFSRQRNGALTALVDAYLAELAIKSNRPDEAARLAARSLRAFTRQNLPARAAHARLLGARAAYLSGNLTKASRMARGALAAAGSGLASAIAYRCHHLIGAVERERGRGKEALASFRRAVETVEHMRGKVVADEFKATFLGDKIEVYEDAIAACLDQGGEALLIEAFRLVESSKSRALADLLARYLRDTASTAEGPATDQRARLLKLIEDLNWYSSHARLEDEKGDQRRARVSINYVREAKACEREIARLFHRIESDDPRIAAIERTQSASAADLCDALEVGETAVEYFTTGDEISAFIASRDRFEVVRGVARKREVEHQLAALRFQIEKFNYGLEFADDHFEQLNAAMNRHLIRLYEMTFSVIEPRTRGPRLIVIPHGPLHYVPFHALLDRRGYVIDRFEISYAPSATVLKLCREQISNFKFEISDKMVALGVASLDTPSIETEVRALGRIFPDAVTLTGERATHDNLMRYAPEARFLHLASHGYFRRDNPMFSFLKLADSPLNFYSLLDLRLKAEMVTLSACHTGVNTVFPGDELHGLMRGFLYAGAPSLVASLWAANDLSTAEFMREMYSRLRAGDTKRAALRSAQLAIKEAYGHAYYWAPFVLMGNPN
jgi:CHAT domain-containing protein/tetratricopeptide (TPR) repeat protein